jgi:hypothetical protein
MKEDVLMWFVCAARGFFEATVFCRASPGKTAAWPRRVCAP